MLCTDDGLDTEHCRKLLFPIYGYTEDRMAQRKKKNREKTKKTRRTGEELNKVRAETQYERVSSCSSGIQNSVLLKSICTDY